jgi:hypothetical protein
MSDTIMWDAPLNQAEDPYAVKYPHIQVDGWSLDQNNFFAICQVRTAMRRGGVPEAECQAFFDHMLSLRRDQVSDAILRYVDVTS